MTDHTSEINTIIDTLSYSNEFKEQTFLIKVGGSILNNTALVTKLCEDIKLLRKSGIKIVLLHGGGIAITQMLNQYAIKSEFIDGIRVTSSKAIKIIEMVLCGYINQLIVRKLNAIGVSAIGLAGSDNSMLKCKPMNQNYGHVGEIESVNIELIENVFAFQHISDLIPVISPIGIDQQGNPLNTNADTAAFHIAIALNVNKLIFLTDQDGIYHADGKLISTLLESDIDKLIDNEIVKDGMLVKTKMIKKALAHGLNEIHILNGNKKHILLEELFTKKGNGTLCQKNNIV